MTRTTWLHHALTRFVHSTHLFVQDVGHGLMVVSHNTLALLGLGAVSIALLFGTHPELRTGLELRALAWLSARHDARVLEGHAEVVPVPEPEAAQRVTAADLTELNRSQATLASHLSRRYKVALEPMARLVLEAWQAGERARIDPTLVLAVMAVESSFNPFAQSPVGAQGLMQVMTRVHDDKFEAFGGQRAALDPVSNLKVGVQVLKECIQRAGGVNEGLRCYVGAVNPDEDNGYAARVLAEQEQLKALLGPRSGPWNANRPAAPASHTPQQVAQS
ncbi:lytic transglycosylase domain-containing protein [Inhella gelatinilytica]|uniref:Lytic transglycosylase domain-containing protein n=1 Tax=Inhella gelatinilytica TaxID=2795030 RepID=A0A931NDE2_9BURK|nr:lytic transglycosylase domain-containing protein [Inhella gelatinilytica]MBH9552992.1 lytic transglycosylase domain-containing protein [Inhella gelatinilytica]